ncbi:FkbM family methyltransferase [Natronorubrum sp. DTA28]|uniref:FkbM family methyltransferase n=1 Tax=Natronorubrum sp. DTA28 TaxID=3447019 RepID=UPI003F875DB0
MTTKSQIGFLLRKVRDIVYRGPVRLIIRHFGLNKLLAIPYWKMVYRFSGNTQLHSINSQPIRFYTNNFTEFMRFRDLSGEKQVIVDLLNSLEDDDVFYDVGANVGTYTCFAASKLDSDQIVAFEPEPQNAARLRENIELNGFDSNILQIALSNNEGNVALTLSGNEPGEGEHSIATDDKTETIQVKSTKGDLVINKYNVPTPSVVKIDVEGAELSVLRGLEKTLLKNIRLVYVEVHTEKITEFGDTPSEVISFLDNIGFNVDEISHRGTEVFLRASK